MASKRIMRLPEVIAATGYKRSSIYSFMAAGTFPQCRSIGPKSGRGRAVGWDSEEIEAWINAALDGPTTISPENPSSASDSD